MDLTSRNVITAVGTPFAVTIDSGSAGGDC